MSEQLVRDLDGIYDVLVEECGAPEGQEIRTDFARNWPACREWRFMGKLGFGGKVNWAHGRLYVSAYPENYTDERIEIMRRANERLVEFVR